jgi:MFS family permease
VVGGFVAGAAGWRALFLGALALSLLLIPFALRVLPDRALGDGEHRGFDVLGGSLLALTAAAALFGVTQGELSGFASISALGSFVLAALAAVLFALRIRTAVEPFVSPTLFGNRAFLAGAALGFCAMFANVAALVMVPLLLSEVNDLPSAAIGLTLAPGAIALAVLSPFAGNLSDRVGPRALILPGLVLMLIGLVFLSSFAAGASPAIVAGGMVILVTGFAAVNSPTANATAATLRGSETGVGLGIYQMSFFLGAGFAPAITGAFVAARADAGGDALDPLYSPELQAPAYSDAFLLVCLAVVLAFVVTFGLKGNTKKGADSP